MRKSSISGLMELLLLWMPVLLVWRGLLRG